MRAHVDCVRGSLCWYVLAAVSLRAQELCVVSHRAHQRVYSRANNATDVRAYRLMRRGLTKQIRFTSKDDDAELQKEVLSGSAGRLLSPL